MDFLYHNSHDEYYRYPFGAVSCDTKIKIRLRVHSRSYPQNVELLFIVNNNKQSYPMILMDESSNQYIYEGEVNASSFPCLMWYYFHVVIDGKSFYYGNNNNMLGGIGEAYSRSPKSYQITVHKKDLSTPSWLKDAVMYQIFVDRFFNGNDHNTIENPKENSLIHSHWKNTPIYIRDIEKGNVVRWDFFGGNLLGILKKLPYLKDLGITAIYLNPIFESSSNHKYDTGDYKKIDSMFGSNELFRELCARAREYGIYIILDGVFSHTGSDSIYFNKDGKYPGLGAYQSKDSPYYRWYKFQEYPNKYESWWGVDSLPNVNEMEPGYQDFIIHDVDSVSRYWVKHGSMGWRLDVVDELPGEFIKMLRKAVKQEDSEAILLGEVWEDASNKISYGNKREYLLGDELDSVTNYPFRQALLDFVLGSINAHTLHCRLMSLYENYPLHHFYSAMNLIGSHDVARALTLVGEMPPEEHLSFEEKYKLQLTPDQMNLAISRMKLLSLFQMTFPGMPCIYYGDEVGMEGYGDPLCRKTYPWGFENHDLLDWYKKIISLRHEFDALKTGKWFSIIMEHDIYGFIRVIDKGLDVFNQSKINNSLLVIFNRSKETGHSINISLNNNIYFGGPITDLLNSNNIINTEEGKLQLTMLPLEGKVLLLS
ncbi:glycoside hydrolase family 13 protein [Desulfitibacter alkalitolerans]|uniref:glycoside hydrolase family 13 protein n=1 Tax=Desulfitibacter alkalitolerans TaxID=264641 RepID=UPI00047FDC53|nr:glycoside hydrolase family 13 protein [Desulfitibacter alkalitolerans]